MSPNKIVLVFLLCILPFILSAQYIISGCITDAGDGSPIPDASVFVSNTTAGTTTNAAGYYHLKIPSGGSYQLVVSHAGYQSIFQDIEPGRISHTFNATLQVREIEEATIALKVSARKKDIDLFWKSILGTTPSKRTIHATNPDDVFFYYNPETQKLTVTCRRPLQIVNYETGYHIQCVLDHFTHDYQADITSWQLQSMFTELEPVNLKQKLIWEKKRKKIYLVSISNFIRSFYQNTLSENGFMLLDVRMKSVTTLKRLLPVSGLQQVIVDYEPDEIHAVNPDDFLSTDSTNHKMVNIPELTEGHEIMLFCFGKPITDKEIQEITAAKKLKTGWRKIGLFRNAVNTPQPINIFPDGTYKNPLKLTSMLSSESLNGLNMILPIEYQLDVDDIVVETFSENEPQKDIMPINRFTTPLLDIAKLFDHQLSVFPQEKVYLHTDKPYYLSGERIWFRAHIVDAATHIPSFSSNCVYVELFNAKDSAVSRIKTGLGNDLYSGYISIPEDVPEGDYTLRAYTAGMRNLDEDYFFMKNIRIGDPLSRIMQVQPEFQFLSDKTIDADFRFSLIRPLVPVNPESLKITVNSEKPANLRTVDGKSGFSFNLTPDEKQRVMLLDAEYETIPFSQYIKIPLPDDDFDVSFYPEGGSALYGIEGRIAFKSTQRDGTEIDVEGTVYDSRGNEITQFKTDMRGMGLFMLKYDTGEAYHAVCTNGKGKSKRFELPAAREDGYALSAVWSRDLLSVNVQPKIADTLCLLIHTRGVVQDVFVLENANEPVIFKKKNFPSGVSHLLLLTKDMVPVCERLVFVQNDDQAKVVSKTDKENYVTRSPVDYMVSITDETGGPLPGNFSVSVTCDNEVAADTMMNILTSLLLTSDLRGNIPDPGFYFRKKGRSSEYALDLLMLTQGWRRYDTERIVKNDLMSLDTLQAKGYGLSGMVRYALGWRPVENANVSILSMGGGFTYETSTDYNGRFYLPDSETPDSTVLIVKTDARADRPVKYELLLDDVSYPERMLPVVANGAPDRVQFANYADKAEQQYVDEFGTRIRHIPEVTITAPKKMGRDYSRYYQPKDVHYVITENDLKKLPPTNITHLILRIPGVHLKDSVFEYAREPVAVVVDDFPPGAVPLDEIVPSQVIQVDFLVRQVGFILERYTISITTTSRKPKETPYIKYFMPLGFQKPSEFYVPEYDTPIKNAKPDLRTTIHWQSNLTTDEEGKASFSFYTADDPSTYTVVIEGMTEDGKIVYQRDKIVVE
ncbi:MAG: carboxypeptidase regulatory-like domain-containing protein [Bacteroidales bacterium]|jgi:hypothetical protein|nr:carboxypeptidase regulatory-like domain-containing protein [Bacteroidales bacterium]